MNAASCIFPQIVVIVVIGFCLRDQRDQRETSGVSLCVLIEYSCVNILSQITQRTQTNAALAALYRRERQVVCC